MFKDDASSEDERTERKRGSPHTKFEQKKIKMIGCHTTKEPARDEFGTEEEFQKMWLFWREKRDRNNNAVCFLALVTLGSVFQSGVLLIHQVRRSRESKRRQARMKRSPCSDKNCAQIESALSIVRGKLALLVKGIRNPSSLSHRERRDYDKVITTC